MSNLRTMTALFFAYSLSYFVLLVGQHTYSDRFHQINNGLFLLLNLGILGTSFYGFAAVGTSKCASGGYGGVLWFLNIVAILFGVIEMGIAHWLYFSVKANEKLPIASLNGDPAPPSEN